MADPEPQLSMQQQAQAAAAALAAFQAQQQAVAQRLPIALHVPQNALPLKHAETRIQPTNRFSLAAGIRDKRSSYAQPPDRPSTSRVPPNVELTLGGSGYGPPVLSTHTPVQEIVEKATRPGSDGKPKDYDCVVVPLSNASWQARWEAMCIEEPDANGLLTSEATREERAREAERWRAGGGFGRGEVNMTRSEEAYGVIIEAPTWLELDSPQEGIRFDSELALKQEVAYASHLGISQIILPPPKNLEYAADYARAVNSALAASQKIMVRCESQ